MKRVSSKKYCVHCVRSVWSGEGICFLVRKSDSMVLGFRYYPIKCCATIKGVYNLYSVPQSLRTMCFLVHDAHENFLNLLSGESIEVK